MSEREYEGFMIELKNVGKSYNGKVIFEDVNLKLSEGTVTAFVGHNGCGKSTMLKVISGLVKTDCGEIVFEQKYQIAYVPEKFPAIPMSARNYLKHISNIDGIYQDPERTEKMSELSEDFFVDGMLDKPMKNLSKGTLQKIGVIQALMSNPDVLLLDEPLSGQDIDSQNVFIEKIKRLKKQGTIILLAAHEPDLIHSLGDNVYTICEGRLTACEDKPRKKYVIWMPQNIEKKASEEMQSADGGYCVYTDERMLSYEINRLQREGWHIGKVYEECKYGEL